MQVDRYLWRAFAPSSDIIADTVEMDHIAASSLAESGRLGGMNLFRHGCHLFLYYETVEYKLHPDNLLQNLSRVLSEWPGENSRRKWIALTDVFHFSTPANQDHWKRKQTVERRIGRIGRLKPETISRYIFYHYALQEEKAFPGDKYEIIGMNENFLFGYFEEPVVFDDRNSRPGLNTKVVPKDWSLAGISDCFIPWSENKDDRFREMEEIMSIWSNDQTTPV